MRFALSIALLLSALPVLASAAPPAAQPVSAPVTYDVWGYRWDGRQWVKDPTRCLATPDPKQAADYAVQVNSVPGWVATTNLPEAYRKAAAGPQAPARRTSTLARSTFAAMPTAARWSTCPT